MNSVMSLRKRFLRFVDHGLVPFCGILFNARNRFINVIYYHDIVRDDGYSFMRTNINVFKRQMEWLVSHGYETFRFDDLNAETLKFKKKHILIAFDDGWRSNYTEIFDYMSNRGLKYNVFLTVGEIDSNPDYLTWEMVRKMQQSGLVGFGAHTFTHPSMADLSQINYQREVNEANNLFYQELGYKPVDFCYPFGYFSEESNVVLEKESSYLRLYTSKKMYSYEQNGKIVFGRNGISTDDSMSVFRKKVKGNMNFLIVYEDHLLNPLVALYHKIRK